MAVTFITLPLQRLIVSGSAIVPQSASFRSTEPTSWLLHSWSAAPLGQSGFFLKMSSKLIDPLSVYLDPNFILFLVGYDPVLEHMELLEYFSSNTKTDSNGGKKMCCCCSSPVSPSENDIVIYKYMHMFLETVDRGRLGGGGGSGLDPSAQRNGMVLFFSLFEKMCVSVEV